MTLQCYNLLQSSAVRDLRLTPMVFQLLNLRMTRAEGLLLLDKLDIVHQSVLARSRTGVEAPAED